jgi:hypothetical protein
MLLLYSNDASRFTTSTYVLTIIASI